VGILERLDPRHWGGRRVLRFLTGLALVALAFVVPADRTPAAAVATVAERPAAAVAPIAAGRADSEQARTEQAHAEQADSEQAQAGAPTGPAGATITRPAGAVVGTDTAPPAGSRPASHGSRAPPAV
jgi:hypothetical protein